jgi:hypothetical protein
MPKPCERVLVIPDLHCPFQHPDAWRFLRAVIRRYQPTRAVCLGDELDLHAMSEHDHDPDGMSAGDEFAAGVKALRVLMDMVPDLDLCISNHTSRGYRRAKKHGIPSAFLKDYRELLGAPPGWSWHDRVEIDDVSHVHGEGVSGKLGALKRALGFMQSTWIGHLHTHAGILSSANSRHLIFGANAGWLGDADRYAFAYAKHFVEKPTVGVGFTDRGLPLWIPMRLAAGGRWVGHL